jgi:hypothetical protein
LRFLAVAYCVVETCGSQVPAILESGFACTAGFTFVSDEVSRSGLGEIVYSKDSRLLRISAAKEAFYTKSVEDEKTTETWTVVRTGLMWDYLVEVTFESWGEVCSSKTKIVCFPEFTRSTVGELATEYEAVNCDDEKIFTVNNGNLASLFIKKSSGSTIRISCNGYLNASDKRIPSICEDSGDPNQIILLVFIFIFAVSVSIVAIALLRRKGIICKKKAHTENAEAQLEPSIDLTSK